MERFNALGRGAQLMLVGGVLLFIDLFFTWQEFDGGTRRRVRGGAPSSGWEGIGLHRWGS